MAPAYGRFWVDLACSTERRRRTVALGVCNSRSEARRKLREHIETAGINSRQSFITNTAPATTFRAQAKRWIASLPTRRRKPVKPATVFGWQHALDQWILPVLGDKFLGEVSNGALRDLVEKMAVAGLSAKTIVNYSQVVKMVVASAVDSDGEQIHPRKWNHNFVGLPIVKKQNQHRPTVTETELGEVLASAKERYAIIFALLAGSGLRIGEALALKSADLSPDCRVLHVRHSIWHGKEQQPKTPNAVREIDLPEPLAAMLRRIITATATDCRSSAVSDYSAKCCPNAGIWNPSPTFAAKVCRQVLSSRICSAYCAVMSLSSCPSQSFRIRTPSANDPIVRAI